MTRDDHHLVMQTVRIAELKARLSQYLRRVRRGHPITILDRDTPIARIVPYDGEAGPWSSASLLRDLPRSMRSRFLSPSRPGRTSSSCCCRSVSSVGDRLHRLLGIASHRIVLGQEPRLP